MPDGNFLGSATILPSSSRDTCQQSSMTMNSYPAAFMPLETMAPAAFFTESSFTLQANLFQLFQPIGGVLANPLSAASSMPGVKSRQANTRSEFRDMRPQTHYLSNRR